MPNKDLLIETIRIQDGRVRHIDYHNTRCNHSRKLLFASNDALNLRSHIITNRVTSSVTKCRITYNDKVQKVEYEAYQIRPISSLKLIEIGDYSYVHKYADRNRLKSFFDKREKHDDILMTKFGILTDTFYANIALFRDGQWYTPESPLLQGTMRSYLIERGKILPVNIHVDELKKFESIRLFNAMIPFGELEMNIEGISSV